MEATTTSCIHSYESPQPNILQVNLTTAFVDPAQFLSELSQIIANKSPPPHYQKDINKNTFNAYIDTLFIQIPITNSHLICHAATQGFVFHHTKPNYVMMSKLLNTQDITSDKLKQKEEMKVNELDHTQYIPKPKHHHRHSHSTPRVCSGPSLKYATHYIGIGGITIREDTGEILAIMEKKGLASRIWKIPGGKAEAGESLAEAATREVFEETGIRTEFVGVLGFRETLEYSFGMPDFYFIALLKPLNTDITIDTKEIKAAKWMPVKEFIAGTPQQIPMLKIMSDVIQTADMKKETLLEIMKSMMMKEGGKSDINGLYPERYKWKFTKKPTTDVFYYPWISRILGDKSKL